uniref:Uncharacterized protein n=1 Tax=Parascaris univalens TaxID=6257 RepID=A0A914ZU13_PARUN
MSRHLLAIDTSKSFERLETRLSLLFPSPFFPFPPLVDEIVGGLAFVLDAFHRLISETNHFFLDIPILLRFEVLHSETLPSISAHCSVIGISVCLYHIASSSQTLSVFQGILFMFHVIPNN